MARGSIQRTAYSGRFSYATAHTDPDPREREREKNSERKSSVEEW